MKGNSKSFKIVSRFYVIYGDGVPIYVGYTNRTVIQRFKEHREEKDFSDLSDIRSVELKGEKLSFDFTWDYYETCKNADMVSKREGQLVNKYHTQDSIFQKAIGGGQTWASEKGFVRNNKDNPKFKGMPATEVKKYLTSQKNQEVWLSSFIGGMKPVQEVWLSNFINDMRPLQESWLRDSVNHMKPVQEVWLSSFVGSMKPVQEVWLRDFVNDMKPVQEVWLKSFINHIEPVQEVWLHNFINHMKPVQEVWLSDFIGSMKPVQEMWLYNFINHMNQKKI